MTLQNKISASLAALLLAGCGGSYNSAATNTVSTDPPTLYTFSGTATAPTATGTTATDAFNQINYIRAKLGLTQLNLSTLLVNAATSHVTYIAANNSLATGSTETLGNPGFTGVAPADRVRAAAYNSAFVTEDMDSSTNPSANAQTYANDLVAAPYRRQALLANFVDGGSAAGAITGTSTTFYVIDLGGVNSTWGPTGNQLLAYPTSGQTGVPTTWNGVDSPAVPGVNGTVGFPISIQGAFNSNSTATLTLAAMSLKDALGNAVPGTLVTTRSDTVSGNLTNYGFFVPAAPLTSGQTYTATATGTYNSQPFTLSWSFTTQ